MRHKTTDFFVPKGVLHRTGGTGALIVWQRCLPTSAKLQDRPENVSEVCPGLS